MTIPRAAIAATRFGTGLSPSLPPPPDGAALLAGLGGPDVVARRLPQAGSVARSTAARRLMALRRADREGVEGARDRFRAQAAAMRVEWARDVARLLARGATAPGGGFRERLAWFWGDHLVAGPKGGPSRFGALAYWEDAIRPHVAGRFADMLVAAVTHPTMILFLDQAQSLGPASPRGRNAKGRRGLNENLAREVLELHTLGVGGAYGQADVRQLAELLTGLTVTRDGATAYDLRMVEPGAERVVGRSYGGDDPALSDIRAALSDLAAHPDTARHVSGKLARHFVSDRPPPPLVAAMERAWRDTAGDLPSVYAAMLDHPAAWAPERVKLRRPVEVVAAGLRALGRGGEIVAMDERDLRRVAVLPMRGMGMDLNAPPGPQGWPEAAAAWATAQSLAARIDWAMTAPRLTGPLPDPRAFAEAALGPFLSGRTRFAAAAAESRDRGVGLVLSSPEFLRR